MGLLCKKIGWWRLHLRVEDLELSNGLVICALRENRGFNWLFGPSLAINKNVFDDVCGGSGFPPARFLLLDPHYFGSGFAG
jgi:hypothetical protein